MASKRILLPIAQLQEGTLTNTMTSSCQDISEALQVNASSCLRPVSCQKPLAEVRNQPPKNEEAFDESAAVFVETAKMGRNHQVCGQLRQALLCYRAALHCKNSTIHSEPSAIQAAFADVLFEIGVIYTTPQLKNDTSCVEAFEKCLDLRRASLGSFHVKVAVVLHRLASVHSSLGDHQYASELLLESLSILLCTCPNHTKALVEVWSALGLMQEALGEIEDAESSKKEVQKLIHQSK